MDLPTFLWEATFFTQYYFFRGLSLDAAHEAEVPVKLVLRLSLILGMVDWCEGHVHQLLDLKGLDLDLRGVHYKVGHYPIALSKVLEQVSLFLVGFDLTCLEEHVLATHVGFLSILHDQGLSL